MMQNFQRVACQKRAQACSPINFYHLRNRLLARNNVTLSEDSRTCHFPKFGRQRNPSQAYVSKNNADYKEGGYDVPRDTLL